MSSIETELGFAFWSYIELFIQSYNAVTSVKMATMLQHLKSKHSYLSINYIYYFICIYVYYLNSVLLLNKIIL